MSYDLKRHRFLKYLSDKSTGFGAGEIIHLYNIPNRYREDIDKIDFITEELLKNKEIERYESGETTATDFTYYYQITDTGKLALSKDKYKNRYWKRFRDRVVAIIQITIPVLALAFSLMIFLWTRSDNQAMRKEFKELRNKVQELQEQKNL